MLHPLQDWPTAVRIRSTDTYAAALGDFIRPLLGRTYNSTAEIDEEVHLVSEQILRVASSLIPTIKQKRLKKCFSNNCNLRSLSSQCKATWSKWCLAGCPREGPEFDEKKRLKSLLRSAQTSAEPIWNINPGKEERSSLKLNILDGSGYHRTKPH